MKKHERKETLGFSTHRLKSATAVLLATVTVSAMLTGCGSKGGSGGNAADTTAAPVVTQQTPETEAPVTEAPATETPATAVPENALGKEFMETMDSYEEFMDEYIAFMKEYSNNPTDSALLGKYSEIMTKYTELMTKISALGDSDLSDAELAYYLEVTNRVSQKLIDVTK